MKTEDLIAASLQKYCTHITVLNSLFVIAGQAKTEVWTMLCQCGKFVHVKH